MNAANFLGSLRARMSGVFESSVIGKPKRTSSEGCRFLLFYPRYQVPSALTSGGKAAINFNLKRKRCMEQIAACQHNNGPGERIKYLVYFQLSSAFIKRSDANFFYWMGFYCNDWILYAERFLLWVFLERETGYGNMKNTTISRTR